MIDPKTVAIDAALIFVSGGCAGILAPIVDRMAGRRCSWPAMALSGIALGASLLWATREWATLAIGLLLGLALLVAAAVDALAYRLPNAVTLPLTTAGGFVAWLQQRSLPDVVLGAAGGFLFLWGADLLYRRIRRRSGIGLGDAKLFAAAGAWLGWQALPSALLLTCAGGLTWAAVRILQGRSHAVDALPLGPPMALAIWVLWLLQGAQV